GRDIPAVGHGGERLGHGCLGGPAHLREGGREGRLGGERGLLGAVGQGVVYRLNADGGRRLPGGDDDCPGDGRLGGVGGGEVPGQRLGQVAGSGARGGGPEPLLDRRVGQRQGQAGRHDPILEVVEHQTAAAAWFAGNGLSPTQEGEQRGHEVLRRRAK